jgi:hypothetical protein
MARGARPDPALVTSRIGHSGDGVTDALLRLDG